MISFDGIEQSYTWIKQYFPQVILLHGLQWSSYRVKSVGLLGQHYGSKVGPKFITFLRPFHSIFAHSAFIVATTVVRIPLAPVCRQRDGGRVHRFQWTVMSNFPTSLNSKTSIYLICLLVYYMPCVNKYNSLDPDAFMTALFLTRSGKVYLYLSWWIEGSLDTIGYNFHQRHNEGNKVGSIKSHWGCMDQTSGVNMYEQRWINML